ncbi:alpha/beta hydrolase [Hyphococcus sp.]|uniref:alpha/beta hydrolase n=1 Tax=Hyphococcus sp. TaxID=2038636 RepID=UPI0020840473|nr:MAG: lysophospholipase [Marinicaulis sp.]
MTDFIDIADNPVPDSASLENITAHDGASLRAGFFPVQNACGTVVLVTGWSEFIEKYFETIRDLNRRGLNVAMIDWRGQGLSDRTSVRASKWRGYFQTLSDDLRVFTEGHVKPRFGGPYILMTHSMGGLPALLLLSQGYDGFARAVLCAPMTRLFPEAQNKILGVASAAACAIGFARAETARAKDHAEIFDGNIFTSDKTRHARFRDLKLAKPEAASTTPTYGWVHDAMKASAAIHAESALSNMRIPVMIVTAGNEQQIDGADHATIAAASKNISLKTIPGALHEIMMERDSIRELYFKAFDEFVAPVLAG